MGTVQLLLAFKHILSRVHQMHDKIRQWLKGGQKLIDEKQANSADGDVIWNTLCKGVIALSFSTWV